MIYYDYQKIEKKWQKHWLDSKLFKTKTDRFHPKYYVLDMFPYPSASGLHVGHIEGYTATDIVSRFKRMQGYNVLHPMGWDAFGLPSEQYALATGKDPKSFTYQNISNFKRQIIEMGKGVDWDKELATTDPEYYRYTQWIFKRLYEKGLAVLKDVEVNWCEGLGTVLANDEIEIVNGQMVSERGHYPVIKKPMRQWVLRITEYADRLLDDLKLVDWPENLKEMQRNWIGKSSGAIIDFKIAGSDDVMSVFTTRPDTIYGVTYVVLSPEHPLVLSITSDDELETVKRYIEQTKMKSDLDRIADKTKTGVFTGAFARHPLTNQLIPIWIADYCLMNYGTGAVMAVPAHDERDYEFAIKFGLEVIEVIKGQGDSPFTGDGIHHHSGIIDGLYNDDAIEKMIQHLESRKIGKRHDTYKLRDWVFSRQRYWGEPFPVLYDQNGNISLVPDDELPLELPYLEFIKPSGTGESPLANALDWLYPEIDGKKYKRDTNTMPQLAGSSWYYIAYILKSNLGYLPLDSQEAKQVLDQFLPVDLYVGGTEHAVGHLLYARFWHKVFYDLGFVSSKEPFMKLVNQGMILGEDHSKMSKSKGNSVSPDDFILSHGADALRLFEMFMGPLESEKPWSNDGLEGAKRFLDRVWRMFDFEIREDNVSELQTIYHQTIKKVTEDYEKLAFNTAISQMMIFVNEVYKVQSIGKKQIRGFLKLLNPIAPHMTEELNSEFLNHHEELIYAEWPIYDPAYLVQNEVELVVQVNGKLRARLQVKKDMPEPDIKELALNHENVLRHTEGLEIVKVIVIPNKIVNIVVKHS